MEKGESALLILISPHISTEAKALLNLDWMVSRFARDNEKLESSAHCDKLAACKRS